MFPSFTVMLSAILCADFGSICANLKRELGDRIGLSKCQRGDGRAAEGSPPVGVMLGLYRDTGKENGKYYSTLGLLCSCWFQMDSKGRDET